MPPLFGWGAKRRRSTDRIESFSTEIAIGFLFEGTFEGEGSYLVQGEVVGNGEIDGVVVLAAGAYWKGDLSADHVRIAGKVEGNLIASAKIELAPTAVVTGNLSSPVIAIAEGAIYEGVISRPRKTRVTRFTERRDPHGTRHNA